MKEKKNVHKLSGGTMVVDTRLGTIENGTKSGKKVLLQEGNVTGINRMQIQRYTRLPASTNILQVGKSLLQSTAAKLYRKEKNGLLSPLSRKDTLVQGCSKAEPFPISYNCFFARVRELHL